MNEYCRLPMLMMEDYETLNNIAERAIRLDLLMNDKFSLCMDLECVKKINGLNLERLLDADDFNFIHDIMGIQSNLNRRTYELENCFLPRFTN